MAELGTATQSRNGHVESRRGPEQRRSALERSPAQPRTAGSRPAGPAADPAGRSRRTRRGLHPGAAAAALAVGQHLVPRRGARAGQHPGFRPGAAGRQPLRRKHDPGHDGLHARLQHLLRRRAGVLPAGPQSGAVDAGARSAAQVRHRRGLAGKRPQGAASPGPRCWSTRAATTRFTVRAGNGTASTSATARDSSAWRSSRECRSCRWSRSAARRPRCS